jgi:hypothetical protein
VNVRVHSSTQAASRVLLWGIKGERFYPVEIGAFVGRQKKFALADFFRISMFEQMHLIFVCSFFSPLLKSIGLDTKPYGQKKVATPVLKSYPFFEEMHQWFSVPSMKG